MCIAQGNIIFVCIWDKVTRSRLSLANIPEWGVEDAVSVHQKPTPV